MILYGNSFIAKQSTGLSLRLQRLEPEDLAFTIDFVQEHPAISFREKMTELKDLKTSITYLANDILHFKVSDSGYEPFGSSILGMWLHDWYFLGAWEGTVPLLNTKNPEENAIKELWGLKQSLVIGAARVPYELIFPWLRTRSQQILWDMFTDDIESRRNKLKRLTRRKLFPRILNKTYDDNTTPDLAFLGNG